jgi:poly-beta-1,6-N-acetyl-D-glucosamine synthase
MQMVLDQISIISLIVLFVIMYSLAYIDYNKERKLKNKPNISFIIPCYNDAKTIGKTIKSIYESYDKNKFEIIVINDKSTDNLSHVLKEVNKKYNFRLFNNEENLGKSPSVNLYYKKAKYEILIFVDADIIVNSKAIYDVLARMENKKVGAVSCPYEPRGQKFKDLLQAMEYNMLSLLQVSYNVFSTTSIWGGFFCIRRKAFDQVKGLSVNYLTEDVDLALKLNEKKWKVEQSFYPVLTLAPSHFRVWFKQKIRWTSGMMQCMITHYKIYLKNPIQIIFMLLFTFAVVGSLTNITHEIIFLNKFWDLYIELSKTLGFLLGLKTIGLAYSYGLLNKILLKLSFVFFSVPYVIPLIKKVRNLPRLLLVFPFSILYFPLYAIVAVMGIFIGFIRYPNLKRGERAW